MKKLSCTSSQVKNIQMSLEALKALDTDMKATGVSFGPAVFSSLAFTFIDT